MTEPDLHVIRFSKRSVDWLMGMLLILVTFIVYLPVWHAGFIWDDTVTLVGNPLVKAADGLRRIWFTTEPFDYFPLTYTSFWLEWRLWGMNPLGYHLVNVFLHALSAVVWWRILVQLKVPHGWLVAALFALHPVNVDSVAWITERKNTLAMLFYSVALLSYLRFDKTKARRWYWCALWAFLFSLLSKPAVATLPFVLPCILWWRHRRITRSDLIRIVPFLAIAITLGLTTMWFQSHRAIGSAVVRVDTLWARIAGAGWAVWFYLYKALLPVNLSFIYPRWEINPRNPLCYLPVLVLVAIFWFMWRCRRTEPARALLFGLGYFVLMLAPVLGFVDIYFMRFSLVEDHWQYFSIIAVPALVVSGLAAMANRTRLFVPITGVVLLSAAGILTWRNCKTYRDEESLWQTTISRNPRCPAAFSNLGNLYLHRGESEKAAMHFLKAIELDPGYEDAWFNMGDVLFQNGRTDQAIDYYRRALQLRPDDEEAHAHLGTAFLKSGRIDAAIECYRKVIGLKPHMIAGYNNLAAVLYQKGMIDDAITQYSKALEIEPENSAIHKNLAFALVAKKEPREAVFHFEKAWQLSPDEPSTLSALAWALATCPDKSLRSPSRAIQLGERADQLSNNSDPVILRTLASVYAAAGRRQDAIQTAKRGVEKAVSQKKTGLTAELEGDIRQYEADPSSPGR